MAWGFQFEKSIGVESLSTLIGSDGGGLTTGTFVTVVLDEVVTVFPFLTMVMTVVVDEVFWVIIFTAGAPNKQGLSVNPRNARSIFFIANKSAGSGRSLADSQKMPAQPLNRGGSKRVKLGKFLRA